MSLARKIRGLPWDKVTVIDGVGDITAITTLIDIKGFLNDNKYENYGHIEDYMY